MSPSLSRLLKWIPNAITVSRAILALAAFLCVLHSKWATGFWLLAAALTTDFLDGLAAKKLHATSKLGEQIDGLADSTIVVLSLLSLGITGHMSWWLVLAILGVGIILGSDKIFDQPFWKWRIVITVAGLFLVWITIAWFYADLAFGWSWLYVPLTFAILTGCGLMKRHRIRTWLVEGTRTPEKGRNRKIQAFIRSEMRL